MEPVIDLQKVCKTYRMGEVDLHVLKDVDLKIEKGQDLVIIGASGSGKSTLLNMIGILDKPSHGHIIIDGKDVSKLNENELAQIRRKKIGFVFQFFYLLPNLTALENVELPMIFAGTNHNRINKAKTLLKKVGLGHRMNHYPGQLSGGERQRVAIARALVNDPDIILADEPTGNLDSKAGKDVMKLLYDLNKERKDLTLIVVTHDREIAKSIKRKIYLKDGQIIKRE